MRKISPGLKILVILMFIFNGSVKPFFAQEEKEKTYREQDFVELIKLDPTFKLDIRYATSNNILGRPLYPESCALLQRPAAQALVRVNQALKEKGYGLVIFDAYRPWSVTKTFWDELSDDQKPLFANPKNGSRHNRGCAVDLSLYDLKTGKTATMPSEFDENSERAFVKYQGGTEESRQLRDLLISTMKVEGFKVFYREWWHFDYKDWREYPLFDISFAEIKASRQK